MTTPTPWARFVMPLQYAADATGTPLGGGKLYFYATGTSTPQDTFADSTLSTPNPNPVVAAQDGTWPPIFLDQKQYSVVLTDTNGTTIWQADPVAPYIPATETLGGTVVAECTVDGNGNVPSTGVCGDAYVPIACTIVAAVLQSNFAGSCVIDVWAAPFVTNTPPTAANSICASDLPTLSSSVSSIDTALTGWTTALAAGTALRFNIVSVSTLTRFTLSLIATATVGTL